MPVVLTGEEVRQVLAHMEGVARLASMLLYGGGLRLLECLRLRVKDVDFRRNELRICDPKGRRDRRTMLPRIAVSDLHQQLETARGLHEADLAEGYGAVWLPDALHRKFPNAEKSWLWQRVFPATRRWHDDATGLQRRHHLSTIIQFSPGVIT